jgi:hypothetical protein
MGSRVLLLSWCAAGILMAACAPAAVTPARPKPSPIPVDACVFMGPSALTNEPYVMSLRKTLLEPTAALFHSVTEVDVYQETGGCDVALKLSQPDGSSAQIDAISTQTDERLTTLREFGPSAAATLTKDLRAAFAPGTALLLRLEAERRQRLPQSAK